MGWGIAGLLLLALAWGGAYPALLGHGFAAHMAMHMTVVALAAPALALGLSGGRLDPAPARGGMALVASAAEFLLVWFWHLPGAHLLARQQGWAMALEQGGFLAAGLLLWLGCLSPAGRRGEGVLALLLTSTHMVLLGVLLAMAPRALYGGHGEALADQQLGAVIMLATGGLAYLAGGLVLAQRLLRGGPA
jgi:putative membrane protein